MSAKTSIEWTGATYNPVTGCTEVSEGCDRCYAKTFAERWRGTPGHYFEHGFDIQLRPDKLMLPMTWSKPRRIFVNSMSDLFHADIPDEYIAKVFAVMAATPQHTYQILSKRHGRMRSLLNSDGFHRAVLAETARQQDEKHPMPAWHPGTRRLKNWPLPNVHLGVSVEDQQWADIRIPALMRTPAAVRFLSCEPLLGPIDLIGDVHAGHEYDDVNGHPHPLVCLTCSTDDEEVEYFRREHTIPGLDWVIAGAESGAGARPMDLGWVRSLRDQCVDAGVAFFFKQDAVKGKKVPTPELDGRTWTQMPTAVAA